MPSARNLLKLSAGNHLGQFPSVRHGKMFVALRPQKECRPFNCWIKLLQSRQSSLVTRAHPNHKFSDLRTLKAFPEIAPQLGTEFVSSRQKCSNRPKKHRSR